MPGRPNTAVMVACMTANGRLSPQLPGRAGGPPPEPRYPGGHPAELLVGPPLLSRAHPALGLVLRVTLPR
jgi:hypothetical protein